MCLSVPAKIISVEEDMAIASIKGVKVEVSLQLVDGAKVGDYVLVHTGYALQILSEEELNDVNLNLTMLENQKFGNET